MTVVTINQAREALATRLESIAGTQVSAYLLGNPTPPSLQVIGGEIVYEETCGAGALMGYMFKVQAMVGVPSDIGAQKRLGEYSDASGSKSIRACIAADKTLGGVVDSAHVESASEEKTYELLSGNVVIGREWLVEVLAAGV